MVAFSDDQLALLDFKNQITNRDTVLANNWTTNTSFCSWVGITCSAPHRRSVIVSLNLSTLNLHGKISPSIANLSSLMTLDLGNNQLTGSIPPSIFDIPSLRRLRLSNNSLSGSFFLLNNNGDGSSNGSFLNTIDLSSNKLTGGFPSGLCRFTELTSLDLSHNNLTGRIPRNIGCLSRLERLYMTENGMTGTIPPSLGNISSLRFLGCVGNNLGGKIPHELGKLSNLQMLGFDFNKLTGEIPPAVFNLSSLVYIAFTDNRLSGNIPADLGLNLPNLEGIYLADNQLQGEIPRAITNASKLKEIELSHNSFVGSVPNDFGNLRELVFLNLAANHLTTRNQELGFLNSLSECRMLQFLIVGNNPLDGIFPPDSVQNLSSSIEMFNVENALVYGEIPPGIGNMSSMLSLVLNGNNLTGNIPSEIGYLNKLQRLYLSKNMLQGNIPVELCNLVNLGEIILFENKLSGSIPSCIGNLVRVQRLMLGYNMLTSGLPLGLWGIKNLLFLNLSNNLIQGGISSEIGILRNIQGIDISSNRLSSVVPSSLGELQNLRYLSLSNNSMEGSIPTTFGNLISLEFLDLSSNNLSGTIPSSLEKLLQLREINLSYNQLHGEIPKNGIFSNSSPESFIGNKDLCVMPPCSATTNNNKGSLNILKIIIPLTASVAFVIIISLLSIWMLLRRRRMVKLENPEPTFRIAAWKKISYREILRATDGFSEANLLGVGGSGSVFMGTLSDSTKVAIKVLDFKDNKEAQKKRFDAECEALKQLRHRNLVTVITCCSNNDSIRAIVLAYMCNGSLESWLYSRQDYVVMDLKRRIDVMIDVAMAVEYLHHGCEFPVVHCDLKPGNVLLDADMVACVSDFGISKILAENKSDAKTKTLGTIGYIAPEYGSDGTVSTKGDVYSYGIMLMEVLTRRKPTDELFGENRSLRHWVKAAYNTNSLIEVIDANLFQEEENGLLLLKINSHHNIITCLSSVIELSLDCSKKAPQDRINMKDAVVRLIKIKQRFLQTKGYHAC
ncbi:hypothetical protein ABFX02_10G137200 [Erythranthe guttata]